MRNHVCWMCRSNTSHEMVADPRWVNTGEAKDFSEDENHRVVATAYQCGVCHGISVAITSADRSVIAAQQMRMLFEAAGNLSDDDITWRPMAGDTKNYPDVPPHIAAAATEAFECDGGGHYRAAILLSRSVIEATAKDQGITGRNLEAKIDAMKDQDLIRPRIAAVAHGVRHFGNDMAHGDFVAAVTAEESALVLQLMGEILDEVYQSPARLAAAEASYTSPASRAAHSSDPLAGRLRPEVYSPSLLRVYPSMVGADHGLGECVRWTHGDLFSRYLKPISGHSRTRRTCLTSSNG